MNKRKIGNRGEDLACRYLEANNVKIIDRNYCTRHGEIDIVARDAEYLVFVEVKFRAEGCMYDPLLAITPAKQRRIVNAARVYLSMHSLTEDIPIRFDAVGICDSEIKWIKNAFLAY